MGLTPQSSRKLKEALGGQAGAELVTHIDRLEAEGAELRHANELYLSRLDALDVRLAESRQATQADLAELRHHLRAELSDSATGLREEMRAGFAEVREQMARMEGRLEAHFERRFNDLFKWSFLFWVGAVGAVAVLAGVLG